MQVGLIGLGKMGSNLCLNMLEKGHSAIVHDISMDNCKLVSEQGAQVAKTVAELVAKLVPPRVVWMMVPAGRPIEELLEVLGELLSAGDIIIDGGNSFYMDSVSRAKNLAERGIGFVDLGTSGGIEGARNGACFMAGGEPGVIDRVDSLFQDLAEPGGYLYCGTSGSGHFVKMVHNGIEYGIMQAIGEGFEIMEKSEYDLSLPKVAELFCHGSVIRSWLMELARDALVSDPNMERVRGVVQSSGEGQWTVETAIRLGVPVPVIASSLFVRYASLQEDSFSAKVVASLRNQFGGHSVQKTE